MPNHVWGDEFDWDALNDACQYIEKSCRRWARMGVWTKEKWGTLRLSTTCAYFTEYDVLHHLFYPGYVRYMFPRWFRTYIDWPFGKVLKCTGILYILQRFQTFVLKFFWKRADKKWPHIREEILDEFFFYFEEEKEEKP